MTKLHECMAVQLREFLEGKGVSEWMTKGRTVLLIRDKTIGNAAGNYRSITCSPVMWIIVEDLCQHPSLNPLLPNEQKSCRKKSRGTKDQLTIDKALLRDCKQRTTNLAIAYMGRL